MTPGTRANLSVCLCPLTVFVSSRAICRKRRRLAPEIDCFTVCFWEQM